MRLLDVTRLGPPELWRALLELKDVPTLYELWCFFRVKRVLDARLGTPEPGRVFRADAMQRGVVRARLAYAGGVELSYNRTFAPGEGGSYSVQLRPDVTVTVGVEASARHLVLDAKLRLDAEAREDGADTEEATSASPLNDDLQKMHVYREAIAGVEGAFVLYPGTELARFEAPGASGRMHFGIGAVPLRPGEVSSALTELVVGFLKEGR